MRNVAKTVVFVLTSLVGGEAHLWAQGQQGGTNNSISIAVIDMVYIFKNHAGFKQQMEAMRLDVVAFGNQIAEENKSLVKMRDRLQNFTPGSPEYKKLEEDLARQASDQEFRGKLKRKDVMDQEAKIYFDTYKEIAREVGKVADSYGINLVLRYENDPVDVRDRNSIMAALNRQILYQRNLDLTQAVMKQLNELSPPPPTNPGQAMRPTGPGAPGSTLRPK